MLVELSIKNFAIIDHLQVRFAPGLNVITGETGAGKSILVTALDFLLGGKAFQDMVRSGEDQAVVEASFDLPEKNSLTVMEPDIENREYLLIRRELNRSGKTKAYINGQGTTLQQIREVGTLLIDIMGQHEHQSLLDSANHLNYLDALGNLTAKTNDFIKKYRAWEEKEKRLKCLRAENEQRNERKRLLEFQIEEIDKAALVFGEERDLAQESKALAHAEKILQTCNKIVYQLQEADNSLLGNLSGFDRELQEISCFDTRLQPMKEEIDTARIQLEEVAYNLQRYLHEVDFNPERQIIVEGRLDELYRLKKKYNQSVEELLSYREEMEQEIQRMELSGEEETVLTEEIAELSDVLCREAKILSQQRKCTAENFQHQIGEELALVGIPDCRLPVQFSSVPADGYMLELDGSKIEETGVDKVKFLFSANPGEKPKDLSRIASGGEISRIMLGLKNLLGQKDTINTLIFDEVDVGIGGKTAFMVGEKLKDIAADHQIICITHLPQIARLADLHLVVDKIRQAHRTVSRIRVLSETEQKEEFARMMGPAA
jgi:DNA repair protein RecN (Recombination protein N)